MTKEKHPNRQIIVEPKNYVSFRIPLTEEEEQRLDEFVSKKGLKKGAFIANLIQTAIKGVRDV